MVWWYLLVGCEIIFSVLVWTVESGVVKLCSCLLHDRNNGDDNAIPPRYKHSPLLPAPVVFHSLRTSLIRRATPPENQSSIDAKDNTGNGYNRYRYADQPTPEPPRGQRYREQESQNVADATTAVLGYASLILYNSPHDTVNTTDSPASRKNGSLPSPPSSTERHIDQSERDILTESHDDQPGRLCEAELDHYHHHHDRHFLLHCKQTDSLNDTAPLDAKDATPILMPGVLRREHQHDAIISSHRDHQGGGEDLEARVRVKIGEGRHALEGRGRGGDADREGATGVVRQAGRWEGKDQKEGELYERSRREAVAAAGRRAKVRQCWYYKVPGIDSEPICRVGGGMG